MNIVDLILVVQPDPEAPPGLEAGADTLLSWLMWGAGIAAFVALVGAGFKIMFGRDNRAGLASDGVSSLFWVFFALAVVSSGAALINAIL